MGDVYDGAVEEEDDDFIVPLLPIHAAAIRGDLEEVMRLVQEDPQVLNTIDSDERMTALHYVSGSGRMEVACYLLDQGADIDAIDSTGETALHWACTRGYLGMVEVLVSRGANPALADCIEWTPLIGAAYSGHMAVVGHLLRIKAVRATIDAQDCEGRTALCLAAYYGHVGVVKLLVEAGANPMIANEEDVQTPMDIAQQHGHHECIELLQVSRCSSSRMAAVNCSHA